MIYRTRVIRIGPDAGIVIPPELVERLGYREGDIVRLSLVAEGDGPRRIIVDLLASSEARTVVEDRYQGGYSRGRYIAWPLPAELVPEASQGDDVTAADFWWGVEHLCGKGDSEEASLADLERELAARRIGVAAGEFEVPVADPAADKAVRKQFEGEQDERDKSD